MLVSGAFQIFMSYWVVFKCLGKQSAGYILPHDYQMKLVMDLVIYGAENATMQVAFGHFYS